MEKNYSKLLWGLVVLAVGVIFTGNVLDLWNIQKELMRIIMDTSIVKT